MDNKVSSISKTQFLYLERTAKFKIETIDLLELTFSFAMCLDLKNKLYLKKMKFISDLKDLITKILNNVKTMFAYITGLVKTLTSAI